MHRAFPLNWVHKTLKLLTKFNNFLQNSSLHIEYVIYSCSQKVFLCFRHETFTSAYERIVLERKIETRWLMKQIEKLTIANISQKKQSEFFQEDKLQSN